MILAGSNGFSSSSLSLALSSRAAIVSGSDAFAFARVDGALHCFVASL